MSKKKIYTDELSTNILDGIIKMKSLKLLKDTDTYSTATSIALPIYETGKFTYEYRKGSHMWYYKPTKQLLGYYTVPSRSVSINPTYPIMTKQEKNARAFILSKLPMDYGVHIGNFYSRIVDINELFNIVMGGL